MSGGIWRAMRPPAQVRVEWASVVPFLVYFLLVRQCGEFHDVGVRLLGEDGVRRLRWRMAGRRPREMWRRAACGAGMTKNIHLNQAAR
jgi:hypothetical protein